MIETDEQRRWWFATHPEYSWSRKGARSPGRGDEEAGPPVYSPEEIDAYVDEGLKHFPEGTVAALLKALKWGLGTSDGRMPPDWLLAGTDLDRPRPPVDHGAGRDKNDEDVRDPSFLHSFFKGLKNTADGISWWDPWYAFISARKLRQAMIKDGRPIPEGHAAHHIVPENDRRFGEAEEARKILEKFGIDLNGSPNGVALPYKLGTTEITYHPGVHTGPYYREVLRLLQSATSKEEATQVLQFVGEQLSKGKFPR